MYSQLLQKQVEQLIHKQNASQDYSEKPQKLEKELYEIKNFEYTSKPGLNQISEHEAASQKGRPHVSPIASAASRQATNNRIRSGNRARLARPAALKPPVGLGLKDPAITVRPRTTVGMKSEMEIYSSQDNREHPGPVAQKIPHLDIMKHNDIELALRYESVQRSLMYTGTATEEQRFRNFKGSVRQVLQQTESTRALNERPPSCCPALYSRLSCHSGKAHAHNMRSVRKRRDLDNRLMSSSKPMRQMMKLQLQYCAKTKKEMVISEPSFEQDQYMNAVLHQMIR